MKTPVQKSIHKKERGQAIILVAFGLIGLVAMVGLVIDTGIMFIEYGKLKRGVDAAAIAAAQQYRSVSGGSTLDAIALVDAAKNYLQLNQSDVADADIVVHSCEDAVVADRPAQCNPDPIGNPKANRKLVTVAASKYVTFGFLRVIGINGTTISTNSTGEAAALDLVLVIDTSASMAYATTGSYNVSDPGDDPTVCNVSNTCQPMKTVKDVALSFIDTMYFPYDRVAIVTMTSQTPGGDRTPMQLIPLTADKATVQAAISGIKVFQPRVCDGTDTIGTCLYYDPVTSVFGGTLCQIYQNHASEATADPSSCPSSNVGGTLLRAASALSDPVNGRPQSFWVVVALMGGPANSTDVNLTYPNGFCPENTWLPGFGPWCRDRYPTVRHSSTATASYTNPINNITKTISIYDADDYARDMADQLAGLTSQTGVTIYTIGLGQQVEDTNTVAAGQPAAAENLLQYIAECAGEHSPDDCRTPISNPVLVHGQYFFAPTGSALANIFELIANNIATRISQ
jgi:hypothetical protein